MAIADIDEFVRYSLTPELTLGLEGDHGIGKTSYVKFSMPLILAERYGIDPSRIHVIIRCASQLDPADLIGEFRSANGRSYNCPPHWIPTAKSYDDEMIRIFGDGNTVEGGYKTTTKYEDFYILFIDEWLRGKPEIANALMELTLDHTIFGVPLHEKCFVAVADNGNLDIYNGNTTIDPAHRDRVISFPYDPTDEEFLEIYKQRVEEGWIHESVLEYLMMYKELIKIDSDTIRDCAAKGEKTASPRAWERIGHHLQVAKTNGLDYVERSAAGPAGHASLLRYANGFVGIHAGGFAQYCSDRKGMSVNIENLIFGDGSPDSAKQRKEDFEKIKNMKPLSFPVFSYNLARTLLKKGMKGKEKDAAGKRLLETLKLMPSEAVVAFWNEWSNNDSTHALEWMNYSGARMDVIYKNLGGYKKWKEEQARLGINLESDDPIKR